ncbi:FliM/FliN family flagellar motor switch protein [Aureimonas populi]|uniref:Flagellar motor switch protein FliM n=1 Tax=Aureimonas populi TaxID=1701758 RepID=A0ABW5CGI5_9HYPH|nr:FliM/FliN family flagellar motor switch protein [Aureimonas populi]
MVLTAERNIGAKLRSAARVEPDRLPRLRALGAEWAQGVAQMLAAEFGQAPQIEFTGASSLALRAGEPLASPVRLMALAPSPGWPRPALVMIEDGVADVVVEGLFGGDGGAGRPSGRALSALDRRFCHLFAERLVSHGNRVFEPIMAPGMAVEKLMGEGIEEHLSQMCEDEPQIFVEMNFRVHVGTLKARLRVALPQAALALHRRKLDRLPEPAPALADEGWARDMEEGLQHADMHLRALLDERSTTLGEIARFTVGQTIVLDTGTESLITVECEEQRLFRGRMGRDRESYLVRIEEKIDPTEEFIDDILSH